MSLYIDLEKVNYNDIDIGYMFRYMYRLVFVLTMCLAIGIYAFRYMFRYAFSIDLDFIIYLNTDIIWVYVWE